MFEEFKSDLERADALQNILTLHATNGSAKDEEYIFLRDHFLRNSKCSELVPSWIKINRNLFQFWNFIKFKFRTYHERREFIKDAFTPIFKALESQNFSPHSDSVTNKLHVISFGEVEEEWKKALLRIENDPEGAVTAAKTLVESTCKCILESVSEPYSKVADLGELYKQVANRLKLSPGQHAHDLIKQILGSCSGVVSGLGEFRNKYGDAHGKGIVRTRIASRHAEFVVNLAGSMSLFLIRTYEFNKSNA